MELAGTHYETADTNGPLPHIRYRQKASKILSAFVDNINNHILAVANTGSELVVCFSSNAASGAPVQKFEISPLDRVARQHVGKVLDFLYGQVCFDRNLMEMPLDMKVAASAALLQNNRFNITANHITQRGMTAQELCGREAVMPVSSQIAQIGAMLGVEIDAHAIVATLERHKRSMPAGRPSGKTDSTPDRHAGLTRT